MHLEAHSWASPLLKLGCSLLGVVALACGAGGNPNKQLNTAGASAAGGTTATGGSTNMSGGTVAVTTSTASAVTTCDQPLDHCVRFVGRFDLFDQRGTQLEWSGTGFVARFMGTGFRVRLSDTQNQFTVIVDGTMMPKLKATAGENWYTLATALPAATHTLEFYRRTEATFGMTIVEGFAVEGSANAPGQFLSPPAAPSRRVEVIGDSISCGYGNEGASATCSFSADTENHYLTYESVFARAVGAELSTVAWSGKGIYYNYNGDRTEPMPTIYDRAVYEDTTTPWNFAWQPDLVVINLGTNDYSTDHDPTADQFVGAYVSFLGHVRSKYPNALILCTIGHMLGESDLAAVRTNINAVVAQRAAAGDNNVRFFEFTTPNSNPGCDYHPSVATHAAMAVELQAEAHSALGW